MAVSAQAISELVKLLEDDEMIVREQAGEALRNIAWKGDKGIGESFLDTKAIPLLVKCLDGYNFSLTEQELGRSMS